MTWIDTYEARVIELAVERLRRDGVFIPELGVRDRDSAPRTLREDVIQRHRPSLSGPTDLRTVKLRGSMQAGRKADETVR